MTTSDYRKGLTSEENTIVSRAGELNRDKKDASPLLESERQAMRAFLQRAETRLSTYQRVAGAFLNGAGLLILLPGLARDSIQSTFFDALSNPSIISFILLAPWLFAVFIPLYALYLLLRDLIQFYFSPRFLAYDPININRFALAGVTLPYDEGVEAKAQVTALKEADDSYVQFALGGTSLETLEKARNESDGGKSAFPLRYAIQKLFIEIDDESKEAASVAGPRGMQRRDAPMTNSEKIGVAFSLSGSLDLPLIGEVARMEASVCRHALQLRKLVLRYSKALLIFVWTTICLILVGSLLRVPLAGAITIELRAVAILLTYAFWAAAATFIIRWPIKWIHGLAAKEGLTSGSVPFQDPDLLSFERVVSRMFWGCFGLSVALAIYVSFAPLKTLIGI